MTIIRREAWSRVSKKALKLYSLRIIHHREFIDVTSLAIECSG